MWCGLDTRTHRSIDRHTYALVVKIIEQSEKDHQAAKLV